MATPILATNTKQTNFRFLIKALKWIAPPLLSIILGYGAVQSARGTNDNRLTNLEKTTEKMLTRDEFTSWASQQRDAQEKIGNKQDQLLTRDEFKIFTDQNNNQLRAIQEELRLLRTRR